MDKNFQGIGVNYLTTSITTNSPSLPVLYDLYTFILQGRLINHVIKFGYARTQHCKTLF